MKHVFLTIALLLSSSLAVADVRDRAPLKKHTPINETIAEKPLRDRLPLKGRRLSWVALTARMQPSAQQTFHIDAGRLSEIELRAGSGMLFVRTVAVDFGDGNLVTYQVFRALEPGQAHAIDLGSSRVIKRVVVSSGYVGLATLQLFGR